MRLCNEAQFIPARDHRSSKLINDLITMLQSAPLPRLSGFLKMRKLCPSPLFATTWKERWFSLVFDRSRIILRYFRDRDAPAKQIWVQSMQLPIRSPALNSCDRYCFQITSSQSEQILLAFETELQMGLWISCISSCMAESSSMDDDQYFNRRLQVE